MDRCEQARELAENGDLVGAEKILRALVEDENSPDRAQAAVGLAVLRDERGDPAEARSAARIALASGHPEYSAQAAYHLALGAEALLARGEMPPRPPRSWARSWRRMRAITLSG